MVYFSKKIYESTKSSEDFNMKIMEGFMEQLLSDIQLILIGGILMMNVYTFTLFYIDKQRAIKHKYKNFRKTTAHLFFFIWRNRFLGKYGDISP